MLSGTQPAPEIWRAWLTAAVSDAFKNAYRLNPKNELGKQKGKIEKLCLWTICGFATSTSWPVAFCWSCGERRPPPPKGNVWGGKLPLLLHVRDLWALSENEKRPSELLLEGGCAYKCKHSKSGEVLIYTPQVVGATPVCQPFWEKDASHKCRR